MTRHLIMAWTIGGAAIRSEPGMFHVGGGIAVAIDLTNRDVNLRELGERYDLKFFEVQQNNFRALVRHAQTLGVRILTIRFQEPLNEVDADYKRSIERRIHEAVSLQDGFAMDDGMYLYSLRGVDVESVTLQIGDISVQYSRLGDVLISGGAETDEKIGETVNSKSICLLTGLVRRDQF